MAAKKKGIVKTVEVDAHKGAKVVREANGAANAVEVLTSGDTQREERWLIRKVGNMIAQRVINKATGIPGKLSGKSKRKK